MCHVQWAFGWAPRFGLFEWEHTKDSQVPRHSNDPMMLAAVGRLTVQEALFTSRRFFVVGTVTCSNSLLGLLLRGCLSVGWLQERTERESTKTTIRRLFRELPAKVEEMWSDGLRHSVRASTLSQDGAPKPTGQLAPA